MKCHQILSDIAGLSLPTRYKGNYYPGLVFDHLYTSSTSFCAWSNFSLRPDNSIFALFSRRFVSCNWACCQFWNTFRGDDKSMTVDLYNVERGIYLNALMKHIFDSTKKTYVIFKCFGKDVQIRICLLKA